jgi:hypothetical protein
VDPAKDLIKDPNKDDPMNDRVKDPAKDLTKDPTTDPVKDPIKARTLCAMCLTDLNFNLDSIRSHLDECHGGIDLKVYFQKFVDRNDLDESLTPSHFEDTYDCYRSLLSIKLN